MIFLKYTPACRHCLLLDDERVYPILHTTEEEIISKTEFEVMKQIEEWRNDGNITCSFCASYNVEIIKIQVNDYSLFNFERLADLCNLKKEYMFQFNIDKSNLKLSINIGGNEPYNSSFLIMVLKKIYEIVNSCPAYYFENQSKGNFYICLVGDFDKNSKEKFVRIEKFKNTGITKKEILDELINYAGQKGLLNSLALSKEQLLRLDMPFSTFNFLAINKKVNNEVLEYEKDWLNFNLPETTINEIKKCVISFKIDGYFTYLFQVIAMNDFEKDKIQIDNPRKILLIYIKYAQKILIDKCQILIKEGDIDLPFEWQNHHENYAKVIEELEMCVYHYVNYNTQIKELLGITDEENPYFDNKSYVFFQQIMYTAFTMSLDRIRLEIDSLSLFGIEILHLKDEARLIIYPTPYAMINNHILKDYTSEERVKSFNKYIQAHGFERLKTNLYPDIKTSVIIRNKDFTFYYNSEMLDWATTFVNNIISKAHITAIMLYGQANYRQF